MEVCFTEFDEQGLEPCINPFGIEPFGAAAPPHQRNRQNLNVPTVLNRLPGHKDPAVTNTERGLRPGTKLEHRVRFELTMVSFCRRMRWTTPPPVHYIVGAMTDR